MEAQQNQRLRDSMYFVLGLPEFNNIELSDIVRGELSIGRGIANPEIIPHDVRARVAARCLQTIATSNYGQVIDIIEQIEPRFVSTFTEAYVALKKNYSEERVFTA